MGVADERVVIDATHLWFHSSAPSLWIGFARLEIGTAVSTKSCAHGFSPLVKAGSPATGSLGGDTFVIPRGYSNIGH
jgi:hypothetical protein